MTRPTPKTALEATVEQNTRDIEHIQEDVKDSMDKMLGAINQMREENNKGMIGLRSDMSARGEQMIGMIHAQNMTLIKGQTDHEAMDIKRFADSAATAKDDINDLSKKLSYYVGWGMGGAAALSLVISIAVETYSKGR